MLEEKRTKMLELFDKYKTFFKIQELEKLGSKEKGIVENTIKDVVLGLFYDDLICGEKVGTSTYYWSNYNKKLLEDIKKINSIDAENKDLRNKIENIKNSIEIEKINKKVTNDRINKINDKENLSNRLEFMMEDLEDFSELSKDQFLEVQKKDIDLVNEVNKVTDNIFIIQDYVSKKFNMDKKEVNKTFYIDDEMDYVTLK